MKATTVNDTEALERLERLIEAEGGVQQFAKRYRIAFSYVYEVRRGTRKIGPALLHILGLERTYKIKEEA